MINVLSKESNATITQRALSTTGVVTAPAVATAVTRTLQPGLVLVVDGVSHRVDATNAGDPRGIIARVLVMRIGDIVTTSPVHVLEDHQGIGRSVQNLGQSMATVVGEHAVNSRHVAKPIAINPWRSRVAARFDEHSGLKRIGNEVRWNCVTVLPTTPNVTEITDVVGARSQIITTVTVTTFLILPHALIGT